METITQIWNGVKPVLDVLGYPATVIVIIAAIIKVYRYMRGIVPVGMRLGKGLSKRKIALFASGNHLQTIKNVVLRSSLFQEENLIEISSVAEFDSHEDADFFIVYYADWKDHFDKILIAKKEQMPLLVYSPTTEPRIDDAVMQEIDQKRNTAVSNFRGRLLNDIFTAMITTNYEK